MTFINRIIALIINRDIPIQAIAIAAVLIPFFHFDTFLSSDHEDNTKNQLYNMYTKATVANIHSVRFMIIFINANVYFSFVSYSSG
jgi:hypothetical protein